MLGMSGLRRTLKSCIGARRITNSNLGSNATQCGKFARFRDIYNTYKNDPAVSQLVRNIHASRAQFEIVLGNLTPGGYNSTKRTQAEYIDYIRQFIAQARSEKELFTRDVQNLPDSQVKEELQYFISFMFTYYIQMFNRFIPFGIADNNTGSNTTSSHSSISEANYVSNWKGGRRKTRRRKHKGGRPYSEPIAEYIQVINEVRGHIRNILTTITDAYYHDPARYNALFRLAKDTDSNTQEVAAFAREETDPNKVMRMAGYISNELEYLRRAATNIVEQA